MASSIPKSLASNDGIDRYKCHRPFTKEKSVTPGQQVRVLFKAFI